MHYQAETGSGMKRPTTDVSFSNLDKFFEGRTVAEGDFEEIDTGGKVVQLEDLLFRDVSLPLGFASLDPLPH